MRLRQAHAILEAATALETTGLGIEMYPFDYDAPGHTRPSDGDQMTGGCEITDPDTPDRNARPYDVVLKASSDGRHIEASVTYGLGPDSDSVLYSKWSVPAGDPDHPRFHGLVGANLAVRIVEEIVKYDQPYRDAYEERSGKTWAMP